MKKDESIPPPVPRHHIQTLDQGSVTSPRGFRAAGVACGIKKSGWLDLGILVSDTPCAAAGVFTRNAVKGASLQVTQRHLKQGTAQAVVVNSGNANACTGERGIQDAITLSTMLAQRLNLKPEDVLPSSTGVIGQFLPLEKLQQGIEHALPRLSDEGGIEMAKAIMTTDTVLKYSARLVEIEGKTFTIGGIAKGSGMIHPNMATMLAYLTTDARVDAPTLNIFLKAAVDSSFNRLSIDGDTSCCDTVLLLANGTQEGVEISLNTHTGYVFLEALKSLCLELTMKMAFDGEGVTTVVKIHIENAPTQEDARRIACTIAKSPLVKTAIHGQDPNWGRFLNALGYSGAAVNPGKVDMWIGKVQVMKNGMKAEYSEEEAHQVMKNEEYEVRLNLNQGSCHDFYITTDFSKEYIDINADYRNRT
ncbi:MAG: bifunctional glutamate N-acetyltransferase/amino-acid acetyltransferase ArgJ [bacterium]|jgi:glutamate N-acetyltransferase/amino-acid N-acetyltransferase